jgi:hypothetical protein
MKIYILFAEEVLQNLHEAVIVGSIIQRNPADLIHYDQAQTRLDEFINTFAVILRRLVT